MKRILGGIWLLAVLAAPVRAEDARHTTSFDNDWRFTTADVPAKAAEMAFDDTSWRQLNVPHDWSIEGPFASTNQTGCAGGFVPSGIGWYRKHFKLPKSEAKRRVFVEFEGVMANSDVWINGFPLGHRPSGYVSFQYELTDHLNFGGKENVLAVKADDSLQPASRFYAGAGIYRHVRLVSTAPVRIAENGVFVTTPEITDAQTRVHIETTLTYSLSAHGIIIVRTTLLGPNGKTVATVDTTSDLDSAAVTTVQHDIVFAHPQLWDLDNPQMYHAVTEILDGRKIVDDQKTPFGIREAKFLPETGFWLNGKNIKLKGVCVHQDGGAFGAAVPMGVWEQRLNALKALGVNAIRTAHNPPAPEFLDLCDRLGLLVMDEMFDCWMVGKSSLAGQHLQDYHLYFADWSLRDTGDIVRRDRNHPSIIVYSAGNEIHDTPNPERAKKILSGLVAAFHENDATRPVTQALFRPNASGDYNNGLADLLDVVGQNYRENEILAAYRQNPARKILGTENRHDRATWVALRDHAEYAGQFLWTGVDYLGETTRWPEIGHPSGLLDRTGTPRAVGYERQSWWSDRPMVYMARRLGATDRLPTDPGYGGAERYRQVLFSDWTVRAPAAQGESVEVYSNCKEVELFLNGQSLGVQALPADASPRVWKVNYAPGTLKAVGKNNGVIAATYELKTAGPAAKIILSNDQPTLTPDWDDVVLVRATVVDENGVPVPRANDLITFQATGPGVIAAVDNMENSATTDPSANSGILSFQSLQRHAAGGPLVAYVKATATKGQITVTASAPGLKSDSLTIKTKK